MLKLIPNKRLQNPRHKGDFDFYFENDNMSVPIGLYNFFIVYDVFTVLNIIIFIQNNPRTMCNYLNWNFKELKTAYEELIRKSKQIKLPLPLEILERPIMAPEY